MRFQKKTLDKRCYSDIRKLRNGRKFKEGTYYYKMEYVLNPFLAEDGQNETKISTGTVYLDWGN